MSYPPNRRLTAASLEGQVITFPQDAPVAMVLLSRLEHAKFVAAGRAGLSEL
jgi:hypothetical protein